MRSTTGSRPDGPRRRGASPANMPPRSRRRFPGAGRSSSGAASDRSRRRRQDADQGDPAAGLDGPETGRSVPAPPTSTTDIDALRRPSEIGRAIAPVGLRPVIDACRSAPIPRFSSTSRRGSTSRSPGPRPSGRTASANSETPPVPWIRTVSPGFGPPPRRTAHARPSPPRRAKWRPPRS